MDDFEAFEGASFLLADLGCQNGRVGLVGEEEPRATLSPSVFVRSSFLPDLRYSRSMFLTK